MSTDARNVGGFQRYSSAALIARMFNVQCVAAVNSTDFSLPRTLLGLVVLCQARLVAAGQSVARRLPARQMTLAGEITNESRSTCDRW
jgi:hypothetical protein